LQTLGDIEAQRVDVGDEHENRRELLAAGRYAELSPERDAVTGLVRTLSPVRLPSRSAPLILPRLCAASNQRASEARPAKRPPRVERLQAATIVGGGSV